MTLPTPLIIHPNDHVRSLRKFLFGALVVVANVFLARRARAVVVLLVIGGRAALLRGLGLDVVAGLVDRVALVCDERVSGSVAAGQCLGACGAGFTSGT